MLLRNHKACYRSIAINIVKTQEVAVELFLRPLCYWSVLYKAAIMYVLPNLIVFQILLLLITRPLPRDESMAEDHGAPEAGQLPRVWTIGHRETESRQRVSGAESPLLDSAE